MARITIDEIQCNHCGRCVDICPFALYSQRTPDSTPVIDHYYLCVSCGHCIAQCPQQAIHHETIPQHMIKPVNTAQMPSANQILELLRSRRSLRIFQSKPVPQQLLERIIEAANYAPSTNNTHSTHFCIVQNPHTINTLSNITLDLSLIHI